MAPRTGFVLQPTYRVHDGVPVVRLFGRLDDGAAFLVEGDRFRPYFFVRARDAHRHYVEKVLRPVAEAILAASDESFDAALGQPSQLSLL